MRFKTLDILHKYLANRIRGYRNEAHLRGLKVWKPAEAGFVCVAFDFQSEGN